MRTPMYKTTFLQFCKNQQVEVKTQKWPGPNDKGFNVSTICTPSNPSLRGSILFLHGAGADRFFPNIQIQSEALLQGWQTICVDMNGHGGESTSTFDVHHSQQFLEMVFSQLAKEQLAAPLHVLGISMGGVMIAEYLALNPQACIASVATWSSPLLVSPHLGSLFIEGLHATHPSIWKHFTDYGIDILPSMGPLRRKHLPFRSENSMSFVKSMLKTIEQKWDFLSSKKLTTPSLHLRGEFDQLCTAESQRRWAQIFPHCTRRTYALQSHATITFSQEARRDTFSFFTQNNSA